MPGNITLQAASVQKLCKCLLTLATDNATKDATLPPDEASRVAIQTTQPALFRSVGLSPRTGARVLSLLTQVGVVSSGRGSLTILNMHSLSLGARGELAAEDATLPPINARKVASSRGGKGGNMPPAKAGKVAEVESLRGALASASVEVESLRAALASAAAEVESLCAQVAALRSDVAVGVSAPAAPTLILDVDTLVGRIVDALRVTISATLSPRHLPPSTTPTPPAKGQDAGKANDLAALHQLVELAGSKSAAGRLLGVSEKTVRNKLKVGQLTDDLAAQVRAALTQLLAKG